MFNSSKSSEYTERKYFLVDERRFYDRAWADRSASLVIADVLGLAAADRAAFSERAVEAGIRSRDGRGGFDFLAAQILDSGFGVERLRQCYTALTANLGSQHLAA